MGPQKMGDYQSEQMGLAVTQLSSDFGGLNPSSTGSNIAGAPSSSSGVAGSTTTAAVAAAAFLDPVSTSLGLGAFELEEVIHARTLWWESAAVRRFMRICALLSLISVSLNTSNTFKRSPDLQYKDSARLIACCHLCSDISFHIRRVIHNLYFEFILPLRNIP